MSNYKLWELANREGVKSLLPHVEEAVLRFQEHPNKMLGRSMPDEIGEPIARYVHGRLMSQARPIRSGDPQPPVPEFTHILHVEGVGPRTEGKTILDLVRQTSQGVLSDTEVIRLAQSLGFILAHYRLAYNLKGTGQNGYFLRPWPADLRWRHVAYGKLDYKTEQRIVEEADKPVHVRYRSSIVVGDIPEKVTPEWAVSTIKRLVKAFDDLAVKYDKLYEQHAEVSAKVEELTRDEWADVGDEIRMAVSNGASVKVPEGVGG